MNHHAVQRGITRLLFDPAFAAALRDAPESTGLQPDEVAALRTIDPRAIAADPDRRRRVLGALVGEFRIATAIVVEEARSLALLEDYFSSTEFHREVEARGSFALGFGRYLLSLCAARLSTERLPDVIRVELAQARTRREARPVVADPAAARVALAPGVIYVRVGGDTLDTIARVERHLFSLGLVPHAARCLDAPALILPPRSQGIADLPLLVVPIGAELSLVTLDEDLRVVIEALGEGARDRAEVEAEAGARIGADRAAAAMAELLDGEVLEPIR